MTAAEYRRRRAELISVATEIHAHNDRSYSVEESCGEATLLINRCDEIMRSSATLDHAPKAEDHHKEARRSVPRRDAKDGSKRKP